MDFYEYKERTRLTKNQSLAKEFLEGKGIDLTKFEAIFDYWRQEKSMDDKFDNNFLMTSLLKLKTGELKRFEQDKDYDKIIIYVDIYVDYLKTSSILLDEVIFSSCDNFSFSKNEAYFRRVEKRLNYTFKNFLQDCLKNLGFRQACGSEAFLREICHIFANLGIYSYGGVLNDVFDDKEKLERLKQSFIKWLGKYIKVETNSKEEIATILFVNEDILDIFGDRALRFFEEMFKYSRENSFGSLIIKFDKKYKILTVSTKNRQYSLSRSLGNEYYISGCDSLEIYGINNEMQGYYEFYSTDIKRELNLRETGKIYKEKKLVKVSDGIAHYSLIEDGDVKIDLDLDLIYDENLIDCIGFREWNLNSGIREYCYFDYGNIILDKKLMLYLNKQKIRYMTLHSPKISLGVKIFSTKKMGEEIRIAEKAKVRARKGEICRHE